MNLVEFFKNTYKLTLFEVQVVGLTFPICKAGFFWGVLAKTQFVQNAKTQFENTKTQFENAKTQFEN